MGKEEEKYGLQRLRRFLGHIMLILTVSEAHICFGHLAK